MKKLIPMFVTGLQVITALVAAYYIFLFIYIAISRIAFPIPFDWVEGAVLVQVHRAMLGQPLYTQPSMEYVPLVYQPVYFYLAAPLLKLLGIGFLAPRLLSVLASGGCMLTIFLLTRHLSSKNHIGILAAGFFAATNGIVWLWFDFAKVDMLCILFLLLGIYFFIQNSQRSSILAAIFCSLAFFTKQTAIPFIALMLMYALLTQRKQAILFVAMVGISIGAITLLMQAQSNGWYAYYVYTLPSYHRINTSPENINYILNSILQPVALMLIMLFIALLWDVRKNFSNHPTRLVVLLTLAAYAVSILGALATGSTRNAFIPAYALTAILLGIGVHHLQEKFKQWQQPLWQVFAMVGLMGLCCIQLVSMNYKTKGYLPDPKDFQEANALLTSLHQTPGQFLIPAYNYLALHAEKTVYYHEAPLGEFNGWYGKNLPAWADIHQQIVTSVQSKQINIIYMNKPDKIWLGLTCKKNHVLQSQRKMVPTLYGMVCQ